MTTEPVVAYPEHEKLMLIEKHSQLLGEFLDWLASDGVALFKLLPSTDVIQQVDGADTAKQRSDRQLYIREQRSIQRLLAEFFDIDQESLEQEKVKMLAYIRQKE